MTGAKGLLVKLLSLGLRAVLVKTDTCFSEMLHSAWQEVMVNEVKDTLPQEQTCGRKGSPRLPDTGRKWPVQSKEVDRGVVPEHESTSGGASSIAHWGWGHGTWAPACHRDRILTHLHPAHIWIKACGS